MRADDCLGPTGLNRADPAGGSLLDLRPAGSQQCLLAAGFRARAFGGEPLGVVTVELKDADFRTVTIGAGAVVSVRAEGCERPACELRGAVAAALVNGVATFSDLAVSRAGTGYSLVFALDPYCEAAACPVRGGLTASSALLDVAVGSFAALVVVARPTVGILGRDLLPASVLWAADAGGNRIENAAVNVTVQGGVIGFGDLKQRYDRFWRVMEAGQAVFDGLFFDLPSEYELVFRAVGAAGQPVAASVRNITVTDKEDYLTLAWQLPAVQPARAALPNATVVVFDR